MIVFPKKISLANIPTPLKTVTFRDRNFIIKRDDFTGAELSGNKVRKLEYILYKAVRRNASKIYTCGGEQSNHSRAALFASASLGMKTKLFLWGEKPQVPAGNLLMDYTAGAEIVYLSREEYDNVNEIMRMEAEKEEALGEKILIVPEGGSSPAGIWGYINFIKELSEQVEPEKFSGILAACGSGGTAAGLLLGSSLFGYNFKIYAVNVLYTPEQMRVRIEKIIKECIKIYNLDVLPDFNNLIFLDGYSKEGYKDISDEKIELIKEFASSTGIIFDPAYTGKAFYAYHQEFLSKKREDVLFLHTGGLFGFFAKPEKYIRL